MTGNSWQLNVNSEIDRKQLLCKKPRIFAVERGSASSNHTLFFGTVPRISKKIKGCSSVFAQHQSR